MRSLPLLAMSLLATAALGQDQPPPLTPAQAAEKANQQVTLEMRVASTGGSRNSYLNSASDFSQANNFTLYIPETARKAFAAAGIEKPDEHFYRQTVQVTGTVTLSRGKPRITLSEPSQIKIIASKAGPAVRKRTHIYKQVANLPIRADSYQFSDEPKQPVIVWIHGGALINGHRESFPEWLYDAAKSSHSVLVSIDYRLAPETQLPEIIADLTDAFRWIRELGPQLLNADPERIAAVGGSAGGYLALTAGYKVQPPLSAVVSLWGYGDLIGPWYSEPSKHERHQKLMMPADEAWAQVTGQPVSDSRERQGNGGAFYQFCRRQGLWPKAVTGWDPHTEAEKFHPYMPLKNVTSTYPPTLLIHGDHDTDVPVEQSQLMAAELKRHNIPHELLIVPGAEHGLPNAPKEKVEAAQTKATEFLKSHLQPNKQ